MVSLTGRLLQDSREGWLVVQVGEAVEQPQTLGQVEPEEQAPLQAALHLAVLLMVQGEAAAEVVRLPVLETVLQAEQADKAKS